jgi:hypothetical protein
MKKKKLAVLCAYPATRNMGMITVDLSAYVILEQYSDYFDCTYYTYGDIDALKSEHLGIPVKYRHIIYEKEEFINSDVYVFWGDFIHARSYQIDLKYRNSPQNEIDELLKISFLDGVDEKHMHKSIVFGGTIITNNAEDQTDDNYVKLFNKFFTNCGTVLFRDALSAAKISIYRNDQSSLGCDCALLLKDSDLNRIDGFVKQEKRNGIGCFIGRSSGKIQSCIIARYLAYKMNTSCSWMSWFPSSKKMRFIAQIFGFNVPDIPPSPGEILSDLSGYEFIVSDTYHLCVNAWRMGIPAVCIGAGASKADTTLNDKKKELIFEMYGGSRFYLYGENIRSLLSINSVANNIIEAINNKKLVNCFRSNINKHIQSSIKNLSKALDKLSLDE